MAPGRGGGGNARINSLDAFIRRRIEVHPVHCPCASCNMVRELVERERARAQERTRVPVQAPAQARAPAPDPIALLSAELDQPHEPPTANAPEDLPDPGASRYPLMRVHREQAGIGTLLAYLFRLLRWRAARWLRPWKDS